MSNQVQRFTGIVRWFSNKKGYGFIAPDQEGTDIFFHYSGIAMEGYKTLKLNDKVEFSIKESPKGPIAIEIKII